MQYHIHDIIHMILHMIYYDIKEMYYVTIEIYDTIVAQGSRCKTIMTCILLRSAKWGVRILRIFLIPDFAYFAYFCVLNRRILHILAEIRIGQENCAFFAYSAYFFAYFCAYFLCLLRIFVYSLRICLRIFCIFICVFCIFCIFRISCIFCNETAYFAYSAYFTFSFYIWLQSALQSVLIRWHILHIALQFFQGEPECQWGKNKIKMPQLAQRLQRHALPTKPLKATTVKLPWINGRKKGYLLNCWTIASFPMKGPSCWHTTTCTSPLCPLICHRHRQESQQIRFASQTELFLLAPLGQEECAPVWRIQELHTKLAQFLCTRRQWLTGMYPTTLYKTVLNYPKYSKYAEYVTYAKYVKYVEYAEYTQYEKQCQVVTVVCDCCTPPAQTQRHSRAFSF